MLNLKLIERIKDCKDYLLFSWSLTISCPSLLSEPLLCFLRPCSCAVGTGSPLHYSALHSHQGRMTTSSPGLHSRVHSPISNMAALRYSKRRLIKCLFIDLFIRSNQGNVCDTNGWWGVTSGHSPSSLLLFSSIAVVPTPQAWQLLLFQVPLDSTRLSTAIPLGGSMAFYPPQTVL